ncbi:MAG: tannase/feruloyl esterase family alpha/beta hydrolase [Acidobacteria bacterium]|nr:tannase/feruloyl esterase family alpha/beta hydrolase [Acidobacteriota bacterium]
MIRASAVAVTLIMAALQGMPCEHLSSLSIPGAAITGAELVAEGPFRQPGAGPAKSGPQSNEPLPAHCRVTMILRPTGDSNIHVELWMPKENWNGKFLAAGNGGWAGAVQGYADMQDGLRRGYAAAATDTGHSAADGPMGMFALGHPEKIVDFAYRAVHDMSVKSKRVITAYYGRPPEYSYFKGCSTGGRQAVMAAQRYPGDFDGIIAGALANRHIHMHTAQVAAAIRLSRNPGQAVSEAEAAMVSEAVMKKCDVLKEGFLNNPRACSFDFSTLLCREAKTDACLTEAQLETVETFYGGVKNGKGELIFAGQSLGNALPAQPSTNREPNAFIWDTVRILGLEDKDYDWRDFDLDRDMPVIDAAAGFVDAVDPDLGAFKAHGGKLLLYHGWGDFGIPPENTIQYYESVLEEMGRGQDDWMRLFMVPGMGHCSGGAGPYSFDALGALEKWREQGMAPDAIMGRNPQSGLARPLCPFPQYAEYDGSGSLADSSNWSCRQPDKNTAEETD